MHGLIMGIRYGARSLRKDWRFSVLVALTLSVCIGANTALFTIVNSVLLRPLPVPDADSLMLMANQYPRAGAGDMSQSAVGDYYDRLRDLNVFEEQALFQMTAGTVNDAGSAERITGMSGTPSLFRLLRIPPGLGRAFTDDEGEIGREAKVILSHGLWQKLYAGDPSVIGRELRLSGRPYTIVGVMPRNFLFVDPDVRYWIPLAFPEQLKTSRHSNNWYSIGRLKPGATRAQAQAQIDALNAANLERFPKFKDVLINAGFHTRVQPLQELLVGDIRSTLYLLWSGAGFVLLIGALNIANLALARTNVRSREFGTRLAVGASLSHIARQVLIENLLLALAGGLAGVAFGAAILRALGTLGLDQFPRASEVQLHAVVVLFSFGVAIAAGLLIAATSLAGVLQRNLMASLRESTRTGGGMRSRLARKAIVVAQVGFTFVLLTGAGLLLVSFRHLLNVDPGYRIEGIVTAATTAPAARYGQPADLRSLMNRSLEAIRRIPGVTAAGATTGIPFGDDYNDSVITAEGYVMKPGESVVSPAQLTVTPGYLEAMNIAVVRGRYFDARDNEASPRAVIVDERLAQRFWPDRDPIGQRMYQPRGPEGMTPNGRTEWLNVVGVVRTVRLATLAETDDFNGAYYFPYAQTTPRSYTLVLKADNAIAGVANALRAGMAKIDPALALFDVRTMSERMELSLSSRKASISLALAFGGLALFLSAFGIYGVLSYLLSVRRREIGIRLAVGSSRIGIFKLVLREGMVLIGSGLILGLAGAAAMRTAIGNQVYGVEPTDPWVIGSVVLLLGIIALIACLRPAQLATGVDPVTALKEQ